MNRKTFLQMLPAAICSTGAINAAEKSARRKKALIAYYSWSGNTRHIAERIRAFTGADILEVVPELAYPSVYRQTVDMAKKENDAEYRRPIKTKPANLSEYDAIFVGSPNWWGTISGPMRTLLYENDFSGKKIMPFITHEGSRLGRAVAEIKKICPKAEVAEAIAIRGGSVKSADADVLKWIEKLGAK